jgi:pilus assembly protein FimV
MAYGLYDQAADLVNGALENDPEDQRLMAKLCEIYFVWGNRDSFVAAADNMKSAVGEGDSSEWDKIVIMGQQIAGDHALFAGAGVAATKAVDLSFEEAAGDTGVLDMDFGGDDDSSGAIDLGAEEGDAEGGVDFLFDEASLGDDVDMELEATVESPTVQTTGTAKTVAMPVQESTVESPTIEQQFDDSEGTSELPSLDDTFGEAVADAGQDAAETAEINLDELDLGLDDLAATELASLDDLDATGTNEAIADDVFADTGSVTGSNPEIDPTSTGVHESLGLGGLDEIGDDDATGEMRLAVDETGRSPMVDITDESLQETEISIDQSLLDSTGLTQVLSDDMAVDTLSGDEGQLPDDAATLLASLDDGEEEDFDFAQTEALPADIFEGDVDPDATGEMPAPTGSTDVDLDLDDLTAALKLSEGGDTIDQLRDDATVEQPRPSISGTTGEAPTMSLGPEDMSDELHEARTMTEVGTKLDLARAYVDMGDPAGARSILEEVLDEGDQGQRQQAQQLLDSLPS